MVEDPGDLQHYFNILKEAGYHVQTCTSYEDGVRCLGEKRFDFVMVSQGTPHFEGCCVLKIATALNRNLPVLVVARYLDMDCYLEAMQLGAVDYLVEPLKVAEIVRVLQNHPPLESSVA